MDIGNIARAVSAHSALFAHFFKRVNPAFSPCTRAFTPLRIPDLFLGELFIKFGIQFFFIIEHCPACAPRNVV